MPAGGRRTLKLSCGMPVPESTDSKPRALSVAEFPLSVDRTVTGILSIVFRGEAISSQTRAPLERAAGQVEAVWRFSGAMIGRCTFAVKSGAC